MERMWLNAFSDLFILASVGERHSCSCDIRMYLSHASYCALSIDACRLGQLTVLLSPLLLQSVLCVGGKSIKQCWVLTAHYRRMTDAACLCVARLEKCEFFLCEKCETVIL